MRQNHENQADQAVLNVGYPVFQLCKALAAMETPRQSGASKRVSRWMDVLRGMASGELKIGSRMPVLGTPVWVTPEVVTGGFATGRHMAGGPLLSHECHMRRELGLSDSSDNRYDLNTYYLSESGQMELNLMLDSGCYRLNTPEEGALLVTAWLLRNNQVEAAGNLLKEIEPWFSRLRFYPVPCDTPIKRDGNVYLENVSEVIKRLEQIAVPKDLLTQIRAVTIWTPLYLQVLDLFLETVVGEAPELVNRPKKGRCWEVSGGTPGAVFPSGWRSRAIQLIKRIKKNRNPNQPGRAFDSFDSFGQLREILEACCENKVGPGKMKLARTIMARSFAKRGLPGSEQRAKFLARQQREIAAPLYRDIAKVMIKRLKKLDQQDGIEDMDPVIANVSQMEGTCHKRGIKAGTVMPGALVRKVGRGKRAGIDELIQDGLITSAETLAIIAPQIAAGDCAAGIKDAALSELYSQIYSAFRKRRSLLLLNFESQMRMSELPWASVLADQRMKSDASMGPAMETLRALAVSAWVHFPHTVLPNKLRSLFKSLAIEANLNLPLVDELAADIFMGSFADKFADAALCAADLLTGSLYEAYYEIDYCHIKNRLKLADDSIGRRDVLKCFRHGTGGPTQRGDVLADMCRSRASSTAASWVVTNGRILEQEAVLTTHNLAVLYQRLSLAKLLSGKLAGMATGCLEFVIRCLDARSPKNVHQGLVLQKNAAYAWRQMVFYLSVMDPDAAAAWLQNASQRLNGLELHCQPGLCAMLDHLIYRANGIGLKVPNCEGKRGRPAYGWDNSMKNI